ncbi:MAG: c-type cytochrome [Verrucomicrobia bacterium]|nr:c-type cytochrome [Verrucomicrobiota bacterium]
MHKFTVQSLCLVASAISVLIPASAGAAGAADVRASAKAALIVPLPDKPPGAENDTPALVSLGKKLYLDKRLSANNSQSCNSCHNIEGKGAGVDNEPTSPGAFGKRGGRNSPTSLNAGFQFAQFWDGRAADLVAQAKGPILNPGEMAMPSEAEVIKKLKATSDYPPLFAKAFTAGGDQLTYDNLARAIAAFERTLVTHDRFDDLLKGNDTSLNAQELKGAELFLKTGCTTCHTGPLIGGNMYMKVGLVNPYETSDLGRFAVTKDNDDKFKFKVPTLRNIALTAPYFHDGKVATLSDAVKKMAWHQLGKELKDDEVKAIVAFLGSLSDKARAAK